MAELCKRVSELLTNGFFVKQTCLLLNMAYVTLGKHLMNANSIR